MIEHEIIVHKTKYQVYQASPPTREYNYSGKKFNQEEYNEYLNDFKFHEGDFICIGTHQITSLMQVYNVLYIETDASKVNYRYRMDDPVCMFLVSVSDTPSPWKKWDSGPGYRCLTQEEFNTLILPERDRIQDHCLKHKDHTRPV
jgi:hypothetical protein